MLDEVVLVLPAQVTSDSEERTGGDDQHTDDDTDQNRGREHETPIWTLRRVGDREKGRATSPGPFDHFTLRLIAILVTSPSWANVAPPSAEPFATVITPDFVPPSWVFTSASMSQPSLTSRSLYHAKTSS